VLPFLFPYNRFIIPPDVIVKQVASNFCQPSDCQNGSTSLRDEVTLIDNHSGYAGKYYSNGLSNTEGGI